MLLRSDVCTKQIKQTCYCPTFQLIDTNRSQFRLNKIKMYVNYHRQLMGAVAYLEFCLEGRGVSIKKSQTRVELLGLHSFNIFNRQQLIENTSPK